MIKVKSLKRHGYGGKIRCQGTEYFIQNEKHVQILCAVRSVKIVLESAPNARLTNNNTGAVANNSDNHSNSDNYNNSSRKRKRKSGRGTYNRKDMIATSYVKKEIDEEN